MIATHPNAYYGLRHGTSEANERGIVVSHPQAGTTSCGLTAAGADECRRRLAPASLSPLVLSRRSTVVLSSDFTRARQTAAILCELHGLEPFRTVTGLRERYFGTLENGDVAGYDQVWSRDATDPHHGWADTESTEAVAQRMRAVIEACERDHSGATIILVSHGDPLQILETVLLGLPSHHHRRRPHLANAELRRLPALQGSGR